MSAYRDAAACPAAVKYACFSALLLLCGCGGPSASDIKSALQDAASSVFGGMATVEDVSDVNCKDAQGKPGFVCSFKITAFNNALKSRNSQVTEARFVQNGSKWVAMNDR
jgi:hypothetical protein